MSHLTELERKKYRDRHEKIINDISDTFTEKEKKERDLFNESKYLWFHFLDLYECYGCDIYPPKDNRIIEVFLEKNEAEIEIKDKQKDELELIDKRNGNNKNMVIYNNFQIKKIFIKKYQELLYQELLEINKKYEII
jgi:hypothetical protein